jgi:hypothetical protein
MGWRFCFSCGAPLNRNGNCSVCLKDPALCTCGPGEIEKDLRDDAS